MLRVEAKIHPIVRSFIEQKDLIRQACGDYEGPVHVVFPQVVEENYQALRKLLETLGITSRLFVAHKTNPSKALLRALYAQGACVDVASLQELQSALMCGYTGERIECTGPKHDVFIQRAIEHECLISVDSLDELETICALQKKIQKPVSILLRISDPQCSDRIIRMRPSKFGLRSVELSQAYTRLKEHPEVHLLGFHIHNNGYESDVRGGFVRYLLTLLYEAHQQGFEPTILNIGGAFRTQILANYHQWSEFIDHLERQVLEQSVSDMWGGNAYGLTGNERGRIEGRESAMQRVYSGSYEQDLRDIFSTDMDDNQSVADHIRESLTTVLVEPGYILFWNSGVTCVQVMTTKEISTGDAAAFVHGNAFTVSSINGLFDLIADPVLLSEKVAQASAIEGWWGFIMGNLCTEDDVLYRRKVRLDQAPQRGDVLCIPNTGAYNLYFSDASPLQQPRGRRFVAILSEDGAWQFSPDDL